MVASEKSLQKEKGQGSEALALMEQLPKEVINPLVEGADLYVIRGALAQSAQLLIQSELLYRCAVGFVSLRQYGCGDMPY
jgi:hypothetical protein